MKKTLLFNPYTGKPRHPSDIVSDPEGVLIVEPGAPLMAAPKTAAQRKAAERARHKEAGRVAVTVYIYPSARERLARYVKRLNERTR